MTFCALFGAVARSLSCRYEWAKDGFGDLLMMALPHHVETMGGTNGEDAAFLMKDSYQSIKVNIGARLEEHTMVYSKARARISSSAWCGSYGLSYE